VRCINPFASRLASHGGTFLVNVIKRLAGLMSYLRQSIEWSLSNTRVSYTRTLSFELDRRNLIHF